MLDQRSFAAAAAELCSGDPDLAAIVERHGLPYFWAREPGFKTLVLLILEQQVSLASAKAAYDRLVARIGGSSRLGACSARPTRSCARTGSAARRPATCACCRLHWRTAASIWTTSGRSTTRRRARRSSRCPGSAPGRPRCYLLSALRRPDTWPVGDIALQEGARRVRRLETSPDGARARRRSAKPGARTAPAAARLLWHLYLRRAAAAAASAVGRNPCRARRAARRRTGHVASATGPPGAALFVKVWKSLCQKRSVLLRTLAGRISVNRPRASGHVAETGLTTPFGPATPTRRPR